VQGGAHPRFRRIIVRLSRSEKGWPQLAPSRRPIPRTNASSAAVLRPARLGGAPRGARDSSRPRCLAQSRDRHPEAATNFPGEAGTAAREPPRKGRRSNGSRARSGARLDLTFWFLPQKMLGVAQRVRAGAFAGSIRFKSGITSKSRSTDTSTWTCEFFITAAYSASRAPRPACASRKVAGFEDVEGCDGEDLGDQLGRRAYGAGGVRHAHAARPDVQHLLEDLAAGDAVELALSDGLKDVAAPRTMRAIGTEGVQEDVRVEDEPSHAGPRVPAQNAPIGLGGHGRRRRDTGHELRHGSDQRRRHHGFGRGARAPRTRAAPCRASKLGADRGERRLNWNARLSPSSSDQARACSVKG
jgi:hypothetical protein